MKFKPNSRNFVETFCKDFCESDLKHMEESENAKEKLNKLNKDLYDLKFGGAKFSTKLESSGSLHSEISKLAGFFNAYDKVRDDNNKADDKLEDLFLATVIVHLKLAPLHVKAEEKKIKEKEEKEKKGKETQTKQREDETEETKNEEKDEEHQTEEEIKERKRREEDEEKVRRKEEEDEIRDIRNIVLNSVVDSTDSFNGKERLELYKFILELLPKSEDKVQLFPNLRCFFFVMGLYLLFGRQAVQKALKQTKEKRYGHPDGILGSLIYFCSDCKVDSIYSVNSDIAKELFKQFFYNRSYDILTFRQFVSDLCYFRITKEGADRDILTFYTNHIYTSMFSKLFLRKMDVELWTEKQKKEQITSCIFPVLLQNGCDFSFFSKTLDASKSVEDYIEKLIKKFREPSAQQESFVREKIPETVQNVDSEVENRIEKLFNDSPTPFVKVSRQLMFEELNKISCFDCHDTLSSVIQSLDDLPTVSVYIAEFLLENIRVSEDDKKSGKIFEIFVACNKDKTMKSVSPGNGILVQSVTESVTNSTNKRVLYGTCDEIKAYIKNPKPNNTKQKEGETAKDEDTPKKEKGKTTEKGRQAQPEFCRFGILAETPKIRSSIPTAKLVPISPIIVCAIVHARIISAHLSSEVKNETIESLEDKTSQSLQTWFEDEYLDWSCDASQWKEHIKIAVSIAIDEKKYVLDEQLKSDREHFATMKGLFAGKWIHLKHAGQKIVHRETPNAYFSTLFPEFKKTDPGQQETPEEENERKRKDGAEAKRKHRTKELTPIFTKNEEEWITAINHEMEVNKDCAVVILTAKEHYEELIQHKINPKDTQSTTDKNKPLEIQISKAEPVLLHIEMEAYVSSLPEVPLHFISCAVPRDNDERGLLLGLTMFRDKIFTQRFILCEAKFSFDTSLLIKRGIPDDWKADKGYSFYVSQMEDFFKKRNKRDEQCWKYYDAAIKILDDDKIMLEGTTYEEKIENFVNLLDKQNKKSKSKIPQFSEISRDIQHEGQRIAYTDRFVNILSDRLLDARQKHFAKINCFRDLLKTVLLTRQYRTKENTEGETVVDFSGDPNKCIEDGETEITFYNRTAFHVNFDDMNNIKQISIQRGDFLFKRYKEHGPLIHYAYKDAKTKIHEIVTIFEMIGRRKNVNNYIKQMLESSQLASKWISQVQAYKIGLPGEIHTNPRTEVLFDNSKEIQEVKIKNVSYTTLVVEVSIFPQNDLLVINSENSIRLTPDETVSVTVKYKQETEEIKPEDKYSIMIKFCDVDSATPKQECKQKQLSINFEL